MNETPLLHYTRQGSGSPLLILHGLYGSGSNWGSHAKWLAEKFDVFLPDLRNHGRSFHDPDMRYSAMASDVRRLMDTLELESALVLGHSMGGKTAMTLALESPERVRALIVADIAPVDYRHHSHQSLITTMRALDFSAIRSRADADAALARNIPDKGLRQFLLTNLRGGPHGYDWRIPLEFLAEGLPQLESFSTLDGRYDGPTLFVYGANSDYVTDEAKEPIQRYFPNAQLRAIENAGHWLHAEQPEAFAGAVRSFLAEVQ